ncbi:MAG: SLC13 family permease, partial [Bacteroidota bacterium]
MVSYPLPKKIGLLSGPLVCILLNVLPLTLVNPEAHLVISVAAWMIIWWITEAVAIPITALLPLTIFPILGIMDLKSVAVHYSNPILYLFFGGFVIALALEKVQLHKRIALSILKLTGTHADGIVLGFMLATALMSMWISNTASTVVMLPIAVSVISLLMHDADGLNPREANFSLTIMLGIAFAANIGGMGTIVGTPPTVLALGFLESEYGISISFVQWMKMGIPFVALMLACCYFLLVKVFYPSGLGEIQSSAGTIDTELAKLGPMKRGEIIVLLIFFCTALTWILRSQLNIWFPDLKLTDTTIAMVAALSLFVVPIEWN